MRLLKSAFSILLLSVIFLTGCKKEIQDDSAVQPSLQNNVPMAKAGMTKAQLEKFRQLIASMPASAQQRMKIKATKFLRLHPEYRQMVKNALNAAPPVCNANTPVFSWLDDQLSDWTEEIIFFAVATGMIDFPTYDALFFENSSSNQYFGVNGDFTQRINKTFKDLKRFWNIQTSDIQLIGLHGTMLHDKDRIIRIDKILFPGDTQEDAEFYANLILQVIDIVPQFRQGNHPIFTFNAFAQRRFNFPPYGIVPNKIVVGDGVLEGFAAIGFADVAPQAILAHEFGHHIQFQLNLFGNQSGPEATRRTELMADAYSAYYLSHARGASMQWKRVQKFLEVFFNLGDCSFDNDGHHGTPTQRMAAARFGYTVANEAQKQGHILTAQQFTALFEAALPGIIAQ
jgi:hypothetical protein